MDSESTRHGSPQQGLIPGRPAGDSLAAARVAEEIAQVGAITFARFMELALYDPVGGYYAHASAGPGPAGDYITSPELHPVFGLVLCGQFEEMWRQLDCPDPFWI